MKRIECWIGLALSAGGAVLMRHAADRPLSVPLSEIVLGYGVGVLALGLLRDLFTLVRKGRSGCTVCRAPRGVAVICAESVFGVALIVLGLALLLLRAERTFELGTGAIGIHAGVIFFLSGLLKDRIVLFARKDDHREITL